MAIDPGDYDCTHGAAKRMYDYWTGDTARNGLIAAGLTPAQQEAQQAAIKSMCYAFAKGWSDEIKANGKAVIQPTDSGLQRIDAVDGLMSTYGPDATKRITIE